MCVCSSVRHDRPTYAHRRSVDIAIYISLFGVGAIPSIMDTTSTDISPNMCQITQSHSQIIASASSVLVVSILLVVLCLFILVYVCMYCFRTGHYILFVSLLLLCL